MTYVQKILGKYRISEINNHVVTRSSNKFMPDVPCMFIPDAVSFQPPKEDPGIPSSDASPPSTLVQYWPVWPVKYGGHGGMWLPGLGIKRLQLVNCHGWVTVKKASYHGPRTLRQPRGEAQYWGSEALGSKGLENKGLLTTWCLVGKQNLQPRESWLTGLHFTYGFLRIQNQITPLSCSWILNLRNWLIMLAVSRYWFWE